MVNKITTHTVSKKEFISKLLDKTGFEDKVIEKVFYGFLDQIVDELKDGNKLEFRRSFILGTKYQNARIGQNPKTLDKVKIPERRVVYFKKGDRLRDIHK
jgi:integration host factor subunit beta